MAARRIGPLAGIGLCVMGVLTVVSAAPLIALLGAGAVASGFGCALDEGSVHPCVVAGADIGEALQVAFVSGWLMVLTAPVMFATLAFWTVYGFRAIVRRRRMRRAEP